MKDMYSKLKNRTELSIPMNKKPCLTTVFKNNDGSGKGNNYNIPEQLDQESSITVKYLVSAHYHVSVHPPLLD